MIRREVKFNPVSAIMGVLFLLVGLFALVWVAKSIFTILAWIAPLLLVATLIIDYRTVLNYGKWILNKLNENFLSGVVYSLLTVFGFPIVSFFLFSKALLSRKIRSIEHSIQEEQQGQYAEYEIVDEEPLILDLPPMEKRKQHQKDDYEQLFD